VTIHKEIKRTPDHKSYVLQGTISYDNAEVMFELRQPSNVQKSYKGRKAFLRYSSLAPS